MKQRFLLKMVLVAAGLFMGLNGAWADVEETVVVNCDFNNGETLFTGVSRMTVDNDNNAKFICANNSQNGYSLATYDFSSLIGTDATAVKIEFAYWIPNQNAAYRRFFTVGQADLRTGFSKTSYSTAGSMFAFGLARNSSANYFSINGASTTAAASADGTVLGAWAHAEIYVDHSTKKVNYKITNMEGTTTYYSADNVAFVDGSASYCNQLDFFDCQNNVVSYLDNLVVTKYVDKSKKSTTYTVKYQNANGTDLKDPVVYDTYVGDTYTASAADMATFYSNDTNTKYVYASGNDSKQATETAAENIITLVFNEYAKFSYTVTAKNGEETLGTLASGEAFADGSTTVYWNKFKEYDGKWYETTGSYGKSITEAGNTDVAYTPSEISYFFEAEELNTSRSGFPTASGFGYSGGSARRNYASGQMWTSAIEEGGRYILSFPYSMANASESTIVIKTRDAEGNFTETDLSLTTKNKGTFSEEITIPAGSSVAICNDATYNSNILIDYLTLTPIETATITAAKYATFVPSIKVAVPDGVTAYYVNEIKNNKAQMKEVSVIPANTPVIIYQEVDTDTEVVFVATADEASNVDGNLLNYSDAETVADGTQYILAEDGGVVGFYKAKNTIPARKAYLVSPVGANFLSFCFDDETTGIEKVENAAVNANGTMFNLAGQRVAQPTKGLYIVNGKKVVVK